MMKAFLSHSSKQQGYVEYVAKRLKKSNIIYDKWTFEEGNKTIDEIFHGLSETEIFVLFISNDALNSTWVQTEIGKAYELIKSGNIKQLYPIIIDPSIKYDDDRIPKWIGENYNLKFVSKPTRASERILQSLRTLSWQLYPSKRELSQLFIGRTTLIKEYEKKIFDFEQPAPITMISTGMPAIGRRKFTLHCLKKSNKIRDSYSPPTVILGRSDGIEDLIISLYDLGLSHKNREELLNLLDRDMKEKISLAAELLLEIEEHESIIFIVDNFSIVGKDSLIVDWFNELIDCISKIERLFICLIARRRVKSSQLIHNSDIFVVELPELEKYERDALFNALLEIEEIQITRNDFNTICELFNGFPEQVFYALEILKAEGLPHLMNNLFLLPDYNSERVTHFVQKYEENSLAVQVLGFLSDNEFVSINLLNEVFGDDFQAVESVLEEFSNSFVVEFIGITREYFRLSDTIRDYISRLGIELDAKYKQNLDRYVKVSFADYDTLDRDVSEYVLTVKEALKMNYDIPQQLLLPSHFLKAMRDLYTNERRYPYVIELADRVLLKEKYLDRKILVEVRNWLCLSLARLKDYRMLEEVQKVDGTNHSFLLGFFYRLTGRHSDALERQQEVLRINPRYYKAKRELVQVYMNLEEYDMAFELAKENYELLKNNPYNVQSYFDCLVKNTNISLDSKKDELKRLVENLKNNPHERAKEMYLLSRARLSAIVDDDDHLALGYVNNAIDSFPKSIYPHLAKIEICRTFRLWSDLEAAINVIRSEFRDDSDIFGRLGYIASEAIILASKGESKASLKIIDDKVKRQFGERICNKLKVEISSIS